MDANGDNPTNITNNPARDFDPSWSTDGTQIAFWTERDGNQEVYTVNLSDLVATNRSNNPGSNDFYPSWSPDGTQIVFVNDVSGIWQIYSMDANGDNQTPLTDSSPNNRYPSWGSNTAILNSPPVANPDSATAAELERFCVTRWLVPYEDEPTMKRSNVKRSNLQTPTGATPESR